MVARGAILLAAREVFVLVAVVALLVWVWVGVVLLHQQRR
jgi:hypothetical protein